jgi:hypothetical protein
MVGLNFFSAEFPLNLGRIPENQDPFRKDFITGDQASCRYDRIFSDRSSV